MNRRAGGQTAGAGRKGLSRPVAPVQRLLGAAVESASEMICITDLADRFIFVNRAFQRTYGYAQAEILGQTPDLIFSPKNPPTLLAEILAQTRLGGWQGEILDRRKDGTEFPVFLSTSPIKDARGQVLGLIGVAQDISERKRAEKQSAAFSQLGRRLGGADTAEEAARIILDIASSLFGWDAGYVHLYAPEDDKLVAVLTVDTIGGRRQEIPDTSFTPDPSPLMRLVMQEGSQLIDRKSGGMLSVELVPFGETARHSAAMMYAAIHSGDAVVGILSIQSYTSHAYSPADLALFSTLADFCGNTLLRINLAEARRAAEKELRLLADAVQSTREMLCVTDTANRFTFVNRATLETYGYTQEEMLGRTPEFLYSPSNPPGLAKTVFEQTLRGGWRGEVLNRRKNNSEFPIQLSTSLIKDSEGRTVGLLAVAADISERKRAEKQSAAFAQLGHRLGAATSARQAAQIILDIASALFGWDAGYVHLYSPDDKLASLLTVDTIEGRRQEVPAANLPLKPTALGRLVLERGCQLINGITAAANPAQPVPFGDVTRRSAAKMLACIRSRGKAIGILSIQSYTEQAYSEDDLRLLQTLADHCGEALERIKVAEALGQAEERLRQAMEAAQFVVWDIDIATGTITYSDNIRAIVGGEDVERYCSVARVLQEMHPEDREATARNLQAALSGQERFEMQYRVRILDGSYRWIHGRGKAVTDGEGRVRRVLGISSDITERKHAEAVLRESEERFRTLFASAPIAIALHDAQGHYAQTNQAYQKMLGYTNEELLRLGTKRVTHPEDIPEGQRLFGELRDGKRDRYQREKRYRHKTGRLVWAISSASAVRDERGELKFIISMVEDISGRKETEARLQESERRLRLIAENTGDAIFAFDMQRRLLYANPAVEILTGYTLEEIQQCGFINWIHPQNQARMLKLWEGLYDGKGYVDVEFRLVAKSGQVKWCSSTWGPLRDEQGQQVGVQGRERDITERKLLERQVLESTAKEQRRLGHDLHDGLGQYLTGIALKAKCIEQALAAAGSPAAESVQELVTLLNQANHQTRALARGLDPVHIETNGLIAALGSLAAEVRELFRIDCAFSCRHERLAITTEAGLALYRIAQEAIRNAAIHGQAGQVQLELALEDDQLRLSVRDNGKGFETEHSPRRGMGLHTMRYRAGSIGGRLEIDSAPGGGTHVRCLVPAQLCLEA